MKRVTSEKTSCAWRRTLSRVIAVLLGLVVVAIVTRANAAGPVELEGSVVDSFWRLPVGHASVTVFRNGTRHVIVKATVHLELGTYSLQVPENEKDVLCEVTAFGFKPVKQRLILDRPGVQPSPTRLEPKLKFDMPVLSQGRGENEGLLQVLLSGRERVKVAALRLRGGLPATEVCAMAGPPLQFTVDSTFQMDRARRGRAPAKLPDSAGTAYLVLSRCSSGELTIELPFARELPVNAPDSDTLIVHLPKTPILTEENGQSRKLLVEFPQPPRPNSSLQIELLLAQGSTQTSFAEPVIRSPQFPVTISVTQ